MATEKCDTCRVNMQIALVPFKELKVEGWKCPKCREVIFTEKQALTIAKAIDQKRLKEKYLKKPVKIGNSLGVIFPKDVVDVFNLSPGKTKLDFRADKPKGKIEITVL